MSSFSCIKPCESFIKPIIKSMYEIRKKEQKFYIYTYIHIRACLTALSSRPSAPPAPPSFPALPPALLLPPPFFPPPREVGEVMCVQAVCLLCAGMVAGIPPNRPSPLAHPLTIDLFDAMVVFLEKRCFSSHFSQCSKWQKAQ